MANPHYRPITDATFLTADELCEAFGLGVRYFERLRKRLEKYRGTHLEGWKRNPRLVYRVGAVRPILEALLERIGRELLGQRLGGDENPSSDAPAGRQFRRRHQRPKVRLPAFSP